METDLKIIRENRVEKYAIEYIRLNRQEEELQKQNKLTDALFKMFENKKKELVNKSYTYKIARFLACILIVDKVHGIIKIILC